MDAQAYANIHWSFNMHIHVCMFSPEVVHFFLFFFVVVLLFFGKM